MPFVIFDTLNKPVPKDERGWLEWLHGEKFVSTYMSQSEDNVFETSSSLVLCAATMYSLCLLAKEAPYPIIRSFAEWVAGRGSVSAAKKGVLATGGFVESGIVPTSPVVGYPTARGIRGKGSYDVGKCATAFLNRYKCKDGADSGGRIHHAKRDKFLLSMSAIIPRFGCREWSSTRTTQLYVDYTEQRHAVEQFIERAPLFMLHAKLFLHPLVCSVLGDVREYRTMMLHRHLAAGGSLSRHTIAAIDVDAANGLLALDITSEHALKGVMDHATAQIAR
jgi:hypothetical protein